MKMHAVAVMSVVAIVSVLTVGVAGPYWATPRQIRRAKDASGEVNGDLWVFPCNDETLVAFA